ncbi:hypothetical protein Bca4012_099306 [Brassica carinata]
MHLHHSMLPQIPSPTSQIHLAAAQSYSLRSDSDPFTSVAYSHLSGRGGVCTLCLILSSSYRSLGLMPHLNTTASSQTGCCSPVASDSTPAPHPSPSNSR